MYHIGRGLIFAMSSTIKFWFEVKTFWFENTAGFNLIIASGLLVILPGHKFYLTELLIFSVHLCYVLIRDCVNIMWIFLIQLITWVLCEGCCLRNWLVYILFIRIKYQNFCLIVIIDIEKLHGKYFQQPS